MKSFLYDINGKARVCIEWHWITRVPAVPRGYATIQSKYFKWSLVSNTAWGVCVSILFDVWH